MISCPKEKAKAPRRPIRSERECVNVKGAPRRVDRSHGMAVSLRTKEKLGSVTTAAALHLGGGRGRVEGGPEFTKPLYRAPYDGCFDATNKLSLCGTNLWEDLGVEKLSRNMATISSLYLALPRGIEPLFQP
jgi:hypothetical protein